jgi:hypothetical protein
VRSLLRRASVLFVVGCSGIATATALAAGPAPDPAPARTTTSPRPEPVTGARPAPAPRTTTSTPKVAVQPQAVRPSPPPPAAPQSIQPVFLQPPPTSSFAPPPPTAARVQTRRTVKAQARQTDLARAQRCEGDWLLRSRLDAHDRGSGARRARSRRHDLPGAFDALFAPQLADDERARAEKRAESRS